MADDYGDIIRRMLRDLEEEDATPKARPAAMGAGGESNMRPISAA